VIVQQVGRVPMVTFKARGLAAAPRRQMAVQRLERVRCIEPQSEALLIDRLLPLGHRAEPPVGHDKDLNRHDAPPQLHSPRPYSNETGTFVNHKSCSRYSAARKECGGSNQRRDKIDLSALGLRAFWAGLDSLEMGLSMHVPNWRRTLALS